MKIVFVSEWFSEKMGYAENLLPKAIAALGHEVHVVSSTAQIYFSSPSYKQTYEPFLGPNIMPEGIKSLDGFLLHRLPVVRMDGLPGIQGLTEYLEKLRPDVVQTFDVYSDSTYDSAVACDRKGMKLFTASHVHASVFQPDEYRRTWKSIVKNLIYRDTPDKRLMFVNDVTIRCYPIAPDAARIAVRYFRVPKRKIQVQSLGVDTELFHPPRSERDESSTREMKHKLGFQDATLVCIYTGRFGRDKNPQCLAHAIQHLQNSGEKVFGLFIGSGTDQETTEISKAQGCVVQSFVPVHDLKKQYWIADVGVWPSQESTSQLDAMACGLPLILSNKIEVIERVEENGLLYAEGESYDLAQKILTLKDAEMRKRMREHGLKKVREQYSWHAIAKNRIQDYSSALG